MNTKQMNKAEAAPAEAGNSSEPCQSADTASEAAHELSREAGLRLAHPWQAHHAHEFAVSRHEVESGTAKTAEERERHLRLASEHRLAAQYWAKREAENKDFGKPKPAPAQVAQHTPTPWESTPGIGCGILYNIGPADTRPVLGVFHAPDKKQPILIAQANADFIVRACNQHEDLMAQVEFASTCNAELRSRITELASALKNLQRNIQRFVANDAPPPWLIDADDQASEVLAKVATQNP